MKNYIALFCLLCILSACASAEEKLGKRYISNADGTVSDMETGLMWADAANDRSVTWQEAEAYCEEFSGGGYLDWRMPTQAELFALLEAGVRKDQKVIRINEDLVWADDTDDSKGGYCNFRNEGCSWMEKVISFALRALPVRDLGGVAGVEPVVADEAVENAEPVSDSSVGMPVNHPQSIEQRLQMLDLLRKQNLITEEEYQQKRAAVVNEL